MADRAIVAGTGITFTDTPGQPLVINAPGGGGSFPGDPALIPFAASIPKTPRSGTYYDQSITAETGSTLATSPTYAFGTLVVSPCEFRFSELGLAVATGASSGTDEAVYAIYGATEFWPTSRLYLSNTLTGFTSPSFRGVTLDFTLQPYTAYWFMVYCKSNPSLRTLGLAAVSSLSLSAQLGNLLHTSLRYTVSNQANPFPETWGENVDSSVNPIRPFSWRMRAY